MGNSRFWLHTRQARNAESRTSISATAPAYEAHASYLSSELLGLSTPGAAQMAGNPQDTWFSLQSQPYGKVEDSETGPTQIAAGPDNTAPVIAVKANTWPLVVHDLPGSFPSQKSAREMLGIAAIAIINAVTIAMNNNPQSRVEHVLFIVIRIFFTLLVRLSKLPLGWRLAFAGQCVESITSLRPSTYRLAHAQRNELCA